MEFAREFAGVRIVFAALAAIFLGGAAEAQFVHAGPEAGAARVEGSYRVAGTIVSGGDGSPLGRARVSLADTRDRKKAEWMITAADGRFEFRAVPAGKYALEGAKKGFRESGYQWHEGFSTAIVTGAGLETENLVLQLIPLGAVSGKVIDEVGEGVRNAQVKLYGENQQRGLDRVVPSGFATTDDEGRYEFPGLVPAKYYLSVTAQPWYAVHPPSENQNGVRVPVETVSRALDVAYETTFYNGATESNGATPISIEKGERATADIHLSPAPALHLFVRMPADQQRFQMPVLSTREFGQEQAVQAEFVGGNETGEMEMVGVPAGKYLIGKPSRSGTVIAAGEMNAAKDGQRVEPVAEEISGRVKVSLKTARGEPLPKGMHLSLRNEGRQTIAWVEVDGNDEATFNYVPAGKYAVLVNSANVAPYTIGRMTVGGIAVEGHDITVAEGASLELNATLMQGRVSVEGVVNKAGRPASGVMVALVPKEPRTHPERFRRDQTDLDGTFHVGGILPGSYTLIAVEDAWGFAWMKQGVLEKYLEHGQNLTIGEMMNGTVVLPDAVEVQPR